MIRTTIVLATLALLPLPAAGQLIKPDPFEYPMTCAEFLAKGSAGRVEALSALPFGDAFGPGDPGASEQFSGRVADACEGHGDTPLVEVAGDALDQD